MSTTLRTLSYAIESTFGSISSSTNLPDHSSYEFVSIPVEKDPLVIFGDELPMSERLDTKDGFYTLPPEPDTVFNGGSRVRRRQGTVTLRLDLTGIGTTSNTYNNTYIDALFKAGFLASSPPFNTADTPSNQTVNSYTPTQTSTDYPIGTLISTVFNNVATYSQVTSNNRGGTGDIGFSPSFPSNSYNSINPMQNYYPASRTQSGDYTSSLCFRIDGVNFRSYAYGCILEGLSISPDNGRLMLDMTFRSPLIQDDHANAQGLFEPVYLGGTPPFFRGCEVVTSTTSPSSLVDKSGNTGDELARASLETETFSFSVTNTLTPILNSTNILGMSNMEISNIDTTLELTLSTVNTLVKDDFFNRTCRNYIVGSGPVGEGQGFAISIPAGYMTQDPSKYDVSGEIVKQVLTIKPTRYAGDTGEADSGNAPFKMAFGI